MKRRRQPSQWIFRLRALPRRNVPPEKLLGRCPRCFITVLDVPNPWPNRCMDKNCPPLEPIKETT